MQDHQAAASVIALPKLPQQMKAKQVPLKLKIPMSKQQKMRKSASSVPVPSHMSRLRLATTRPAISVP
jgi:hypothetical protein